MPFWFRHPFGRGGSLGGISACRVSADSSIRALASVPPAPTGMGSQSHLRRRAPARAWAVSDPSSVERVPLTIAKHIAPTTSPHTITIFSIAFPTTSSTGRPRAKITSHRGVESYLEWVIRSRGSCFWAG